MPWYLNPKLIFPLAGLAYVSFMMRLCGDTYEVDWQKVAEEQQKQHEEVLRQTEEAYSRERAAILEQQEKLRKDLERSKKTFEAEKTSLDKKIQAEHSRLVVEFRDDPQGMARALARTFNMTVMERQK